MHTDRPEFAHRPVCGRASGTDEGAQPPSETAEFAHRVPGARARGRPQTAVGLIERKGSARLIWAFLMLAWLGAQRERVAVARLLSAGRDGGGTTSASSGIPWTCRSRAGPPRFAHAQAQRGRPGTSLRRCWRCASRRRVRPGEVGCRRRAQPAARISSRTCGSMAPARFAMSGVG